MSRKYILPFLIVLSLLIILLPACGGGDDETPAPTLTPTATATVTATATPTATPTTTSTPTPTPTTTATPTTTPFVPSKTELPCRFHGTVQLNGANVPNYTTITVTILGNVYNTVTPSIYGDSTYIIKISPPEGMVFNTGTPLTFKIDDVTAQQTGSWEKGGNIELNISASSP